MHRRIAVTALAATMATTLAATFAVAPAGATIATTTTGTGREDKRLVQEAANDLAAFGITGVQALIRDGHRTTEARAGVADVTTNRPVPKNGYFRIGSNTKTFVSVIVLQLVGEGRLRLDDPVERWLPGLVTGNGHDGSKITIRHLLRHQSGLTEYLDDLQLQTVEDFERHRFDHWEDEGLVRLALAHPPLFEPGTQWSYSNTNYILAGMVIKSVTGKPWHAHLQQRILRPAGMTQTVYPGDKADLPNPHAQAYEVFDPDGTRLDTTRWNATAAGAAGGLVSTPTDLSRFWQALQSGKLLRPAEFREMHQTVPLGDGVGYGLGIFFTPSECGGFWGHDGGTPGMYTMNGVTSDGDRSVIISISSAPADPANASARAAQLVTDALCQDR
ncbi:serine hydrolase domain-containing protein [Catenuloplanes atrovinosus]|uniref:D-alanyl-D-alanine carboxypeptidase n=1 Tax=Catenuloplanes atrovinosus TaxID=137266 RepID=A0AAE4CEN0_9ACTN|nr:serine hydrolase domain-containing protein [Catenuloplanes atrovinosus]MDR7278790.1 D-alanyl-D-alanine carboxypeptidase [Catenuloplanes atrovinosus]